MNHWASRYGISENTQDTYKKAKDKHMGRYVAVNLENYGTVEFRIFRGSLRYKTFIAALQLVDTICRLAIGLSDKELEFKHGDGVKALIGHTRHSTQGSEKKIYNNHPFLGKTSGGKFALAHNGVLINDYDLRKDLKLPKTQIETDSFVAVQLIEKKRRLNFESLKYMAEKVCGSFSFSVLDECGNIYLVKGDSPLCLLHFPKLKMYVYASTKEILFRALIDSPLFDSVSKCEFEFIDIDEGEILKLCADGSIEKGEFEHQMYVGRNWWDYGYYTVKPYHGKYDRAYIDDLKAIAAYNGYYPEDIDELLDSGFSFDEIEEYIYCMEGEV